MKIQYKWDIKELMQKVQKDVASNDWSFLVNWVWDDRAKGKMRVKGVEVHFEILWEIISLEIVDKPFLASKSYVEDKIKEMIAKYI